MYTENRSGWRCRNSMGGGCVVAENRWGWSCRNSMGGGYGGGARFECTLRIAGAGDAEMAGEEAGEEVTVGEPVRYGEVGMAWEEATEGERGLSVR